MSGFDYKGGSDLLGSLLSYQQPNYGFGGSGSAASGGFKMPGTASNPLGAGIGMPGQAGGNSPDWMQQLFGYKDTQSGNSFGGYAAPVVGAAKGLFDGFMAMKNYGLAKEGLAENKRQFALNYGAQASTTNARLADRQAARVTGSAGQTSVDDYMRKYGVPKV